jgi:hypothetical protein
MNSPPLTRRDAWSATFEHVLDELTSPRTDCPLHAPNAPPPTRFDEAEYPLHDLQLGMTHCHLVCFLGSYSLEIIVFSCHFFLQFFLLLQISRLH